MNKRIKYTKVKKSSGKRFCDQLWALIVRTKWDSKCAICGDTNMPNAHHLISRKVFKYRWETSNSLLLCPLHHEFSVEISAHCSPWGLEKWMKENKPDLYKTHVDQRESIENVKTDYEEIYYKLEQEYKELTGEYYMISRLSQYIMFKNASNINALHIHEGKSIEEIANIYNVSKNTMKKFMIENKII